MILNIFHVLIRSSYIIRSSRLPPPAVGTCSCPRSKKVILRQRLRPPIPSHHSARSNRCGKKKSYQRTAPSNSQSFFFAVLDCLTTSFAVRISVDLIARPLGTKPRS
ncbi:hypothetical protein BDW74DRAFT_94347 [Aspergillus multicolor]|uniref:uncharacterized protein n=1 Tax=Aspergillus multicolor TaxID=41759 RepID=UPI003CCD215E